MRRIPVGALKKKLADLEGQAAELTRIMLGRGELAQQLALRTIADEELDALEACTRRLEQDPAAALLPSEQLALERFRELEAKYAACRTAKEATAIYRGYWPEMQLHGIGDLVRQLTAAAPAIPGNGQGGRQGGKL